MSLSTRHHTMVSFLFAYSPDGLTRSDQTSTLSRIRLQPLYRSLNIGAWRDELCQLACSASLLAAFLSLSPPVSPKRAFPPTRDLETIALVCDRSASTCTQEYCLSPPSPMFNRATESAASPSGSFTFRGVASRNLHSSPRCLLCSP